MSQSSPANDGRSPSTPIRRRIVDIDGLDGLHDIVRGANFDVRQLSRGRLETTLTHIAIGGVCLDVHRSSLPLATRAGGSRETVSFVLPSTPLVYNGVPLDAGDIVVYPTNAIHEGFSRTAICNYVLSVRPESLAAHADSVCSHANFDLLSVFTKLPIPRETALKLTRLCAALEGEGQEPTLMEPNREAAIADEVMSALCEILAFRGKRVPLGLQGLRQTRLVNDAETWLDLEWHDELTVRAMCESMGVSVRTLQKAFRSIVGIGPCEFGRISRLNAVRRVLIGGRAKSVTDAAFRHGFEHLGRFAKYYRDLFQERPSATLRRGLLHPRSTP